VAGGSARDQGAATAKVDANALLTGLCAAAHRPDENGERSVPILKKHLGEGAVESTSALCPCVGRRAPSQPGSLGAALHHKAQRGHAVSIFGAVAACGRASAATRALGFARWLSIRALHLNGRNRQRFARLPAAHITDLPDA